MGTGRWRVGTWVDPFGGGTGDGPLFRIGRPVHALPDGCSSRRRTYMKRFRVPDGNEESTGVKEVTHHLLTGG
ncbi:hypothetical protein CS0771_22060 [Catellatospora sp. IY07-71]|nr:hypothetical protein CS0771_22060 [Catellatospora sp. IY07-71]